MPEPSSIVFSLSGIEQRLAQQRAPARPHLLPVAGTQRAAAHRHGRDAFVVDGELFHQLRQTRLHRRHVHRLRHKPNAPPTRLLAAGYLLNEHRDYLSSIEQRLRDWGLASEFTYAGAPDRAGKIAMIRQMDLFSVPAVYAEPKGLSLLEAMANGVPIVQPRRGAFTEIAQRTGGGVLVAPDEPEALADALLALLLDRDRAAALGRAGAEGVKQQYSVDQMAHAAEKVYGELHARPVRA